MNPKNGKYFKVREFECKDGSNEVKQELIDRLDLLREEFGSPIKITSGYRSPEYNIKIGGAKNSSHCLGIAADIAGKDMDKLYILCCKYFMAVGDGRNKGFIHVDLRDDKVRRWGY